MTRAFLLAASLLLTAASDEAILPTSSAAAPYLTLYDRLAEAQKQQPRAALRAVAPEMASVSVLAGSWRDDYHVFATPRRAEHHLPGRAHIALDADQRWLVIDCDDASSHDRFFLGFDRLSKVWRLAEVEHPVVEGGAIRPSSDDWSTGRLRFEAEPARIAGIPFVGRVSLIRVNGDILRILWEERVSPDLWVAVDEHLLHRVTESRP